MKGGLIKKFMNKTAILFVTCFLLFLSLTSAAFSELRPTSTGSHSNWNNFSCSSSNEWQCVNEVISNTSNYLFTGSANTAETFNFSNLGLTNEAVRGVRFYYHAKRFSGTKYYFAPYFKTSNNGSFFKGGNMFFYSVYSYGYREFRNNPLTNTSWTISELDNLVSGMITPSANGGAYVSQMHIRVDYDNASMNTDLATIGSVNFREYNLTGSNSTNSNSTNGTQTYLFGNAKITNNGGNTANSSVVLINGLINSNQSIGEVFPGENRTVSFYYACTTAHNLTVTFDAYNNITESNENNNQVSTYVDCLA